MKKKSVVKIGKDRILRVNGRRFFPIGARHLPKGATPSILKGAGFNCMRWMAFDIDAIRATDLQDILDAGMMFYPYIYNRGDFSKDRELRKKELAELVLSVRENPLLLCYEQQNEPAYRYGDWATLKGSPEGMKEASDFLRGMDPFHPIRLGHGLGNLVRTIQKFNSSADIIGCNPYVVYNQGMRINCATRMDGRISDSPDQTISAVGEYTAKMMRAADGRPVWMQLQAFSNEDWYNPGLYNPELKGQGIYPHDRLFPNYHQMRFMAFHAVIRGATAMEWCMYGLSVQDSQWAEVKRVISELSALQDVLASPNAGFEPSICYTELGFSDWNGVETLTKRCRGGLALIAANTQFDPMEAQFTFGEKARPVKASLFGSEEIMAADGITAVKDGAFKAFFAPYEVKIYFLK